MKHQHPFPIAWKDPETGEELTGQFTTKRLTIQDKARLGVRVSQLCGGMYCVREPDPDDPDGPGKPTGQGIDAETQFMNEMLAHMELALIQKPKWFNLAELCDLDLMKEVYGHVVDYELSFKSRRGAGGGPGGVRQEDGGSKPEGPKPADQPAQVVGPEVRASLD
jgi:hypothetical protein